MLGRRMVGALLVLVGMTAFFLGGVVYFIEATDPLYSTIEPQAAGQTTLLMTIGLAVTLAGGIVLLVSPARRLA